MEVSVYILSNFVASNVGRYIISTKKNKVCQEMLWACDFVFALLDLETFTN